ncbi:MAG: type I DNA topoisomerase [Clostridiales bacterium]|jgi:DNA topoisomerase-1|nr:type I DNA topoisomerase [Clostridiales bacterium]
MSSKKLVIVESPAKAKTLKKFLSSAYKIEASVGHVRDLPKSELGIDVENDFEPKYITIRGKGEILAKLRKEAKAAQAVYLATDPDREGEAISWHLKNALKLDSAYRITFNEITKNAVQKSITEARQIDMNLVNAQQARRALDRIVGYKISPLLWRKVRKRLSAGRVQSVGLKIICDREEEISSFVQEEYWSIETELKKKSGEKFKSQLHSKNGEKLSLKTKDETDAVIDELRKEKFSVLEAKNGQRLKKPAPPFTTSTLQQEASKVLGFATSKTMMIAQQLYEGVDIAGQGTIGLVSYIRTDSVRVSDESYAAAADFVKNNLGEKYLNPERVVYQSKGRAQDAHEAIHPTYIEQTPEALKTHLPRDQFRLYKLIWERFAASVMSPAVYDTITARIEAGPYHLRASGSQLKFQGYLAVYNKNETDAEKDVKMPSLTKGEPLTAAAITGEQHFTQPPPRYTEAALVKNLEDLGIGRPSTYSAIISTLLARGYVIKENKSLYPAELGIIVNDIMEDNFRDVVNIGFTAEMEDMLDKVEDGQTEWKEILRAFYPEFEKEVSAAETKIGDVEIADEVTDVICENCGRNMVIKFGRFGKFLACPGFPECRNAKPFFEDAKIACPVCEDGKVLIKKTKKGRKYYGCSNNPDCSFLSWEKPVGKKCPKCGGFLVAKGKKAKKAACAQAGCGYSEDLAEEE